MQPTHNKLLSICIPTYNRSGKLKDCLENLIPKTKAFSIPIFISDNCSTDNTHEIALQYRKLYEHIHYSCNSENLGEINFEIVLKKSDTRYAWLLSDDDRLVDDSIPKVLSLISESEHDLLVINGGLPEDGSGRILARVRDIPSKIYKDRSHLLSDLGWHMTWMSTLIFGEEIRRHGNFAKYYRTCLVQFGTIFDYLKKETISVPWISEPVLYCSDKDHPGWLYAIFDIWAVSWSKVINSLPPCYTKEAKEAAIMAHGVRSGLFSAKGFLHLMMLGYYDLSVYRKYREHFPEVTNVPLLLLRLLALPPWAAKLLSRMYRIVRPDG